VHLTSAVAVLVCVAEGEVLALVGDYALGSVRDSVIDLVSHVHVILSFALIISLFISPLDFASPCDFAV